MASVSTPMASHLSASRELNTQPESNQTAEPATLGSRSNSDILQNVNVQPFLKVLLHGSFALRIRRVEMGRGESQRKKKKWNITVLLEGATAEKEAD